MERRSMNRWRSNEWRRNGNYLNELEGASLARLSGGGRTRHSSDAMDRKGAASVRECRLRSMAEAAPAAVAQEADSEKISAAAERRELLQLRNQVRELRETTKELEK